MSNITAEHKLIYLDDPEDSNPRVRCPVCGFGSRLMEGFSYLRAGFNGIQAGDPDDCGLQECGSCEARLKW
jgi:hypothetical protein